MSRSSMNCMSGRNIHSRRLHMINTFRSEMRRPIVGIGHSMGGNHILQLALLHPRLFSTIVCLEPIVNRPSSAMNFAAAYWFTNRRDIWPTRKEAASDSRKSPIFKGWDARCFDLWIEYGLRSLPTLLYPEAPPHVVRRASANDNETPVTLTTTKHHEVRSFARPCFHPPGQPLESFNPQRSTHADITGVEHRQMDCPFYRPEATYVFSQLSHVRPSCLYLYGSKSTFTSASQQGRADKLRVTGVGLSGSGGVEAGKVDEAVLEGAGHLLPFEMPEQVSHHISSWIDARIEEWRCEDRTEQESWKQVGIKEKAMVDEEWKFWAKYYHEKKNGGERAKARTMSVAKL